ncbi:MAG: FtsX-like permease family protein [Candidatus Asgardarchaeia archaeon]
MITLKFAIRNLKRRKIRTVVALIGIIIASTLFVSVNATIDELNYTLVKSFTDFLGDFDILAYKKGVSPFFDPLNVTHIVNEVSEVSAVVPRLIFRGTIKQGYNTTLGVLLVGINLTIDNQIGTFNVIKGGLNLDENETVILPTIATRLNVRVGDYINMTTFNFQNKTFVSTQLRVSGIVEQQGKLPLNMRNVIFTSTTTLQKMLGLFENQSANFLFIKLKEDVFDYNDIEGTLNKLVEIGSKIQLKLGLGYTVSLVKGDVFERVSTALESQRIMLNIFVFVTILISAVLISSTMLMNVNERIKEFGILRSIGFSRFSIFLMVFVESAILGILGATIGVAIGYIIGTNPALSIFALPTRGSTVVQHSLQNNAAIISIHPNTLIFGFVIGFTLSIISGLYPSYISFNLTPIEALSPAARKTIKIEKHIKKMDPDKVNWSAFLFGIAMFLIMSLIIIIFPLATFYLGQSTRILITFLSLGLLIIGIAIAFTAILPALIKGFSRVVAYVFKLEGVLSGRNLIRYKRRTALTFFMLTTSIAFIIMTGALTQSYSALAQVTIKYETGADIVVYLNEHVPDSAIYNISKIEGVYEFTPVTEPINAKVGDLIFWKQYNVRIYGINVTTFPKTTYIENIVIDAPHGEHAFDLLNQDNKTVAVAKGLADALNMRLGDSLRIEISGNSKIMCIGLIASSIPGFSFTKFEQRAIRTDVLVSLSTYMNLTNGDVSYERILVRVKEGYNPMDVANLIQNSLGSEYDIQVVTTQELIESAQESYNRVLQLFTTLLSFAIVISVLGHVTSLLTTVRERIWEIGILRSLGLSRSQILNIFIVESIILAISGFVCGFFSGILVVVELAYVNNLMSDILMPIAIPTDLLFIILSLVLIVSILASYVFTKKPIDINIVEALRYSLRE